MNEKNVKYLLQDLVFDLKSELNGQSNFADDYGKGQQIAKIEVLTKIKSWLIGEYDDVIKEIGLDIDIEKELLNV
jgi:hypothetical protein